MSGLSNFFGEVFTIINQIPESDIVTTKTAFIKHRLENCGKKEGIYDKSSGTTIYRANTWTGYIKCWEKYKKPMWNDGGYYTLDDKQRMEFFTAGVGDLIIFDDIPDEAPKDLREFSALRDKYKNMGGIISGVEVYINYKASGEPWKTNHIEVIKA